MSHCFPGARMSTALVTGAAGGIGEALATALARDGFRVAVADIDEAGAHRVAERIGGVGIPVDVSDQDSVASAVRAAAGALGLIDVLVNNAGVVGGFGPLATLPLDALGAVLRVNV